MDINKLITKAQQGEYDAMYSIWKLTCESRGSLDADNIPIVSSKEWLLKSAKGGYVLAQYALGLCYMEEYDIHEIDPNAFCYECFTNKYCHCKSNEKLNAYIPDNYDFGFEKDVDKSLYWLIKAARQKHLPAIAMLDIHYGHMVDINIKLEEVA
ncbi:MAG: sel1 repeat family protein [Legionellales bacterium]|nr:sel1 repeat family protein [Legionellales bacterium]